MCKSNYIVIAECLIVIIVVWVKILKAIHDRRYRKWQNVNKALRDANSQPLDKAIETLRSVGIVYRDAIAFNLNPFEVPKYFWSPDDVNYRARALITLITYDEKHTCSNGQSSRDLADFLGKQTKKNLGVVLAIVCELAKQVDGKILEGFYRRLPYVKS